MNEASIEFRRVIEEKGTGARGKQEGRFSNLRKLRWRRSYEADFKAGQK